jgi:hypothetical protein
MPLRSRPSQVCVCLFATQHLCVTPRLLVPHLPVHDLVLDLHGAELLKEWQKQSFVVRNQGLPRVDIHMCLWLTNRGVGEGFDIGHSGTAFPQCNAGWSVMCGTFTNADPHTHPPCFAEASLLLGAVDMSRGSYEEARKRFDTVKPDEGMAQDPYAQVSLGNLAFVQGGGSPDDKEWERLVRTAFGHYKTVLKVRAWSGEMKRVLRGLQSALVTACVGGGGGVRRLRYSPAQDLSLPLQTLLKGLFRVLRC